MTRPTSVLACAALAYAVAGCASYQAAPLDRKGIIDELNEVSPQQVVTRGDTPRTHPQVDLTDGLGEAEVVAVALTLNPQLRAKRLEIGEAESLLVSAGVWPNPELGVSVGDGINGASGYTAGADLLFDLLAFRERGAARQAAEAQANVARAEVLAQEASLSREVRRQWLQVLAGEANLAQLARATELRRKSAELVDDRRRAGDVTELDVSAAQLDLGQSEREMREARRELLAARRELNRLLGLPAAYDLRLTDVGKPLQIRTTRPLDEVRLKEYAFADRYELQAREADYERAEQELRLAVIRQFPRVAIGPTYERELDGGEALGLGASLELPLFDRNQGEIAEKRAQRDRLREEYRSALHEIRATAAAAYAELVEAEEELAIQEQQLLPLVQRNRELYEGAFRAGELPVLDWLVAEGHALEVQREYLNAAVRYRAATIDLETALGLTPLTGPPAAPAATNESR